MTLNTVFLFQLAFEGIVGRSYRSDIAIDDFSISLGACAAKGACDFEKGLCGYSNVGGDDFDWTRDNGGTPSTRTGPHNDHTTNTAAGRWTCDFFS